MGLYQALTNFYDRTAGLPSPGFGKSRTVWVVRLNMNGSPCYGNNPLPNDRFPHFIPKSPPDRTSGSVSTSLLVDKASYALGLGKASDARSKAAAENDAFRQLLETCLNAAQLSQRAGSEFLGEPASEDTILTLAAVVQFQKQHLNKFVGDLPNAVKDTSMVAFFVESFRFAFDDTWLVRWLSDYHSIRLSEGCREVNCVTCGIQNKAPRLSPKVSLFGSVTPISDFNMASSRSAELKQMENSPICRACGGKAQSALGYLLQRDEVIGKDGKLKTSKSGPHSVVLAEDMKKGGGERPLSNQIAIFWTKEKVLVSSQKGSDDDLEQKLSLTLDAELDEGIATDVTLMPEARSGQLRRFLESPWFCRSNAVSVFNTTSFYFAILSPNTGRLVLREWIETDLNGVRSTLMAYRDALSVASLSDGQLVTPAVRQVLTALRAPREAKQASKEGPRFSEVEPELTRLLIRTMFQGTAPPEALLTRALRAFRLPASAKDEAFGRLLDRRTALIAAIKLVLTHNNEITSHAMTQLHTDKDAECAYKWESPYLCGRVLALLNTIQHRASSSGRGVNTTLVDKFYAAASTAPQSVFGRLLSNASSAHLPKLRKDITKDTHTLSDGSRRRLSEMLTEVVNLLDAACGPKRQHTTREQGAFALGFYHEQAALQHPKTTAP